MKKIGIIGGSGLETLDIFSNAREVIIQTPYGETSSSILSGEINNVQVFILSRHGRQHTIPPTQVNNRANIWALKEAGCEHILATTACGSLRENIQRGHLVFPDQFIDFTKHRDTTFYSSFENGNLKHTPMAEPFSIHLRKVLAGSAEKFNLPFHKSGTVITIEGPRFSTRAESNMFRQWGADIINMSTAPECALANEAGIPYAAIALSTDYDCWKTDEEPVTWEEVLKVFQQNVKNVTNLIIDVLEEI